MRLWPALLRALAVLALWAELVVLMAVIVG
jgi:hypothetical protein